VCRLDQQLRKQTVSEDDGRGVSFECRVHGLFQEIEPDGRIGASDSMRFSGCRDVSWGYESEGNTRPKLAFCYCSMHFECA
jgi:hypothetical protein